MLSLTLLLLWPPIAVLGGGAPRDAPARCMIHCDIASGLVPGPTGCSCVRANLAASYLDCPAVSCPLRTCAVFKKDALGCPTCQCKCPDVKIPCKIDGCRFSPRAGRDVNGCPQCQCRPPRRARSAMLLPRRCPMRCAIRCKNGQVLDRHGCPLCMCRRP